MLVGIAVGVPVALMRLSGGEILPLCAQAFTWFFRGVPVLVQLVFWYNLAALFPTLSLGIPFGGPKLVEVSSTVAINSFLPPCSASASTKPPTWPRSSGPGSSPSTPARPKPPARWATGPCQTFRVVILPQAMRAIVPPTGIR